MAGPGAQMFVDGFRGGRLPPKDQIQQIRFNSNSFSAEYHDAGMVRVEVITRPGMGGWRGRVQLRVPRRVAERAQRVLRRKEPTQQAALRVQLPGAARQGQDRHLDVGGRQQRLRLAHDRARPRRTATVTGQVRRPNNTTDFNVPRRARRWARATPIRAESDAGATQTASNLGVGDFDLPEHAYDTDTTSNDTFRVRNTRVLGKKAVQRAEVRVHRVLDHQPVALATRRPSGCSMPSPAAAPASPATRQAAQLVVDQGVDFTDAQARGARRPAVRGRLVEPHAADQRQRHLRLLERWRTTTLDGRSTYTQRVGDPAGRLLAGGRRAGILQDDFRLSKNVDGEPRPAAGAADAGQRQVQPRAARGVHLDGRQEDHRARRLGPLLRLVRLQSLRADAARRRHHAARRDGHRPDATRVGAGTGTRLPAQPHPARAVARPAARAAGLDRHRAQRPRLARAARRLHVDARLRCATARSTSMRRSTACGPIRRSATSREISRAATAPAIG